MFVTLGAVPLVLFFTAGKIPNDLLSGQLTPNNEEFTMKKFWILAIVAVAGVLAGCSTTDESTSAPNPSAPETVEGKGGANDAQAGSAQMGPGAKDADKILGSALKK